MKNQSYILYYIIHINVYFIYIYRYTPNSPETNPPFMTEKPIPPPGSIGPTLDFFSSFPGFSFTFSFEHREAPLRISISRSQVTGGDWRSRNPVYSQTPLFWEGPIADS